MKRGFAIIMTICLMAGIITGCGVKATDNTSISTSAVFETENSSATSLSEKELTTDEATSAYRSNNADDFMNVDIVETADSLEGSDVSSDEEEIDWTREYSYFYYVQEALRKNPGLKELDGHTIEISEERTLILDGIDTETNIDYDDDWCWDTCVPTENGSYFGRIIGNRIYVVPDWYNGETVSYDSHYTDRNGVTTEVTYQIPLILKDERNDDDYQYDYLGLIEDENGEFIKDENGETVPYYAPYTTERFMLISLYYYGEVVESYFLIDFDDNMTYYDVYPVAIENNRLLVNCGTLWGVCDLESKSFEIITHDALDYQYPIGDKLIYTDWNHDEHSCDWSKNSKSVKTGNKVIYYFNTDFELVKKDDYQEIFTEIQESIRTGESSVDDYDINYSDILTVDGVSLGNIHLPYATERNYNIMYSNAYSCWLIEDGVMTMYRYGEEVQRYILPEVENPNQWRIIESYLRYHMDANEAFVKYIIDTNNNGRITAEELENAIVNMNVLLFNNGDVYMLNQNGVFIKIATGVVDYCEAYGEFYWMDKNFNAYENSWLDYSGNILIGKNVVGISKYTDERAGFLVSPTDSRANSCMDGYYFCTLYGDDWLNQEASSGAWALEYDWTE